MTNNAPPELAIVIPTFNERKNVSTLTALLDKTLTGISWEAIFVDDDSQDGTSDELRLLGQNDPRIRCLKRIGRRGLSSACVEGMLATGAPYVAVMDADLQHDHTRLPVMLEKLKEKNADLVYGSRYTQGGGTGDWNARRKWISKVATRFSGLFTHHHLSDPMSGFFMLKRTFFESVVRKLSGKGFKILFDIAASAPAQAKFIEVPFTFGVRQEGESKLGAVVVRDYFALLAEKGLGSLIPLRFLMFVSVGLIGAVAHIAILALCMKGFKFSFLNSQLIATMIAMTVNFILNNAFSYSDQKLKGLRFFTGLISFYIACALGAFINLLVATFLYQSGIPWWISGLLGGVVGAVWNYAITSTLTWNQKYTAS